MRFAAVAALAAVNVFPCFVLAQSTSEVDAVVITASRTEQRLRDAVPHTTLLTRREIEDSQAPDLPSLLRREAGFQFAQNGGIGAVTGIFMRGGRGAQALVLVDGVRIEDAGFGTTAIQHILLDDVERVEIVRGNVSSLYGSGAISGVIQIFTRRGEGAPASSVEATAGARGTGKLNAAYGGRVGETRFSISASKFVTDGFSAIDPREAPNANPDEDGYRNTSFAGSLSHRLSTRNEVGLTVYVTDGRVEYDTTFHTPTDRHLSEQRLEAVSGWWETKPLERWTSRVTLGQGTDDRTDYLNGAIDSVSNTRNRQAAWSNDVRITPEHTVSAGAEVLRQELVNSAFARQDRNVDVLRAGYLGRVGPHSAQISLRWEDYSDFGEADTYFAGYGYDLTDEWRLLASAGSAFRAPNFQDLYSPFGGNPNLKPERARTKELGIQWAEGAHLARLTAFDTEYQDAITSSPTSPFDRRNVLEASVEGIELTYRGRLYGFDLKGSVTSQNAIEQEPGAPALRAVRRAKVHSSFSAHRSLGPWRFGAEVFSSGPRPDFDIQTFARVQTAGYSIVNLLARYEISRQWHVAARLENALDDEYRLIDGYNTAGRGLFVTLEWKP